MKKVLFSAMFAFGLAASTIAQAVVITDTDAGTVNGADAGSIDSLLEVRTRRDLRDSGLTQSQFELDFINDYADPDLSFSIDHHKIETVDIYSTDVTDVFAFGPVGLGDFFIVKNGRFWALFQNLASSDFGVFDISDDSLPERMNLGGATVSHVTFSPRGTTTVPEPSALLLLTLGLAGLGFASRKKETAQ